MMVDAIVVTATVAPVLAPGVPRAVSFSSIIATPALFASCSCPSREPAASWQPALDSAYGFVSQKRSKLVDADAKSDSQPAPSKRIEAQDAYFVGACAKRVIRQVGVYHNQKTRFQTADHAKTGARCTYAAAIAWLMSYGPRRQGFTIFILPARVVPLATPPPGATFLWRTLLGADHLGIVRRLFEKAALQHPVDLLLEFVGAISLDPDELRHHAAGALAGGEIAQDLIARTRLVLIEPGNGTIEPTAQLGCRLFIDIFAGDDATAPAQVTKFAGACRERAADQRFHQGRGFRLSAQQSLEPVIGMHELDLGKRNPGGFERLDRGIEGAGMPGYRDRHVA